VKIQLPISLVLNETFKDVFRLLCADSAVKKADVWPLVRTGKRVEEGIRLFNRRRSKIIRLLGVENKENKTWLLPNEKQGEFTERVMKLISEFPPVETFFELPIVLEDPLPADSQLTAAHIATLIDVGLVHNPDKNENDDTQDTEEAPAPGSETGNGTDDTMDGVAGRKEA
jgi:hypothetical protein